MKVTFGFVMPGTTRWLAQVHISADWNPEIFGFGRTYKCDLFFFYVF
jgi:thiol:disulfide interchange protein